VRRAGAAAHLALGLLLLAGVAAVAAPPAGGRVELVAGDGLNEPFGVAFDREGRTYVVEMGGNRVTVLDGRGGRRILADDFKGPHHLLLGPEGALYVTDTWNNRVRRFDLRTGQSSVVAGTGEKGFGGDGGPATAAQFGGIFSIAFHKGVLYICDLDNRRVRAVDPRTGVVTTVAGNGEKGVPRDGEDARTQPLVDPRAIAIDAKGNLYIGERGGHALRVVDPAGKIRTVVGTGVAGQSGDGGPARVAQLNGPKHIFVEPSGDVLITDTENHVIRRYSTRDGTIRRVAGTGVQGTGGLGGPALECPLNRPHGAVIHPKTGELYVADSENHRVLRVRLQSQGGTSRMIATGARTAGHQRADWLLPP
jgi:DNA-binding beta-propeller fold protein YncE